MLGIIRVLTTEDDAVLGSHGRQITESTGVATTTRCVPDQPHGIYDDESEARAIPKIVALARELESSGGLRAITISCAGDPGLRETRAEVSLPVIGAGETGALAARMVSDSVAVIGITENVPEGMRAALGDALHSFRYAPGYRKSPDLLTDGAREALLEAAQAANNEGATAILFACTGFSTIGLKSYLDARLPIPSIDLVEAQGIAYSLLAQEERS